MSGSKEPLIDFDDMLTYTYELFSQRKDILFGMAEKVPLYSDWWVSGYQSDPVEDHVYACRTGKYGNLFVVGDDDQSIYRFRGSKPEIMLGFSKDMPTPGKDCDLE